MVVLTVLLASKAYCAGKHLMLSGLHHHASSTSTTEMAAGETGQIGILGGLFRGAVVYVNGVKDGLSHMLAHKDDDITNETKLKRHLMPLMIMQNFMKKRARKHQLHPDALCSMELMDAHIKAATHFLVGFRLKRAMHAHLSLTQCSRSAQRFSHYLKDKDFLVAILTQEAAERCICDIHELLESRALRRVMTSIEKKGFHSGKQMLGQAQIDLKRRITTLLRDDMSRVGLGK